MSSLGKKWKLSAKTKENMSKARMGNKNCVGRVYSEETKRKISEAKKGRKPWNTGKKHTEETRKKISEARKGKKPWNIGKKWSKEMIKKLSEAKRGEKSHFWKGGISNCPYPIDWTKTLKRSIRERDHYTCQLCGCEQGDIAHSIHHIDYDKQNCNPDNLITLCKRCHTKTNNNREYWKKYFKKLLNRKLWQIKNSQTDQS